MIPFASQRKDAEDVLSSIRRMVSEEAKAKVAETTSRLELTAADMVPPEPLVLTPDQAVEQVVEETPKNAAEPSDPIADALSARNPDNAAPVQAEASNNADAEEIPAALSEADDKADAPGIAAEFDIPPEDIAPMPETQFVDSDTVREDDNKAAADDSPETGTVDQVSPTPVVPINFAPKTVETAPAAEVSEADGSESETRRSPNLLVDEIDPEDAPFMDEVAMRKMIGEMIREELEGEMGERITRNIRNLIRREIARALSMKS